MQKDQIGGEKNRGLQPDFQQGNLQNILRNTNEKTSEERRSVQWSKLGFNIWWKMFFIQNKDFKRVSSKQATHEKLLDTLFVKPEISWGRCCLYHKEKTSFV